MPNSPSDGARPSGAPHRIKVQRRGPLLVEGPVEVELEDGTTVYSDRFRVALCTCRRSRRFPWCDTSHRARAPGTSDGRSAAAEPTPDDPPSATD